MLLRSTSLYTERTMMHFSPDSFRVSLSPSRVVELVELSILRASPFLFELGETTPFSFFFPLAKWYRTQAVLWTEATHAAAHSHNPPSLALIRSHTLSVVLLAAAKACPCALSRSIQFQGGIYCFVNGMVGLSKVTRELKTTIDDDVAIVFLIRSG